MTKKFVNLPQNYKNVLDGIKKIFTIEILKELASNNISYKDILKLHNAIEKICIENNCNSYDLNKMINYYDKQNSIIEILKKISSLRNKYIVYYAKKSDLWNQNLNEIKNKYKKISGKNINLDKIEHAFVKILKKYKYDWDGLWSMIEITKNGNILKVNLFDIDDFNELCLILNK